MVKTAIIDNFLKFTVSLQEGEIKFNKDSFLEVVQNYSFLYISENRPLKEDDEKKSSKKSKFAIFSQSEELNKINYKKFLIIGFEMTIIILEETSISNFLHFLSSTNPNLSIYFLSNYRNLIGNTIKFQDFALTDEFIEEIINFITNLISN